MWTQRAILGIGIALASSGGCKEQSEGAGAASPAASAPASKKAAEVIRFVGQPVEVGQKWKNKRQSRLSMSVEFWIEATQQRWGTADSTRDENVEVVDEVLARVGGRPGKVKATYAVHRVKEDHPDRGKREDAVLEGRVFVLDVTENKPVATDAEGKAVDDTEAQSLWSHHADLGKDDPLVQELGVRAIRVGDKMPMKEPLFRALLGTTAGEFKSGAATVTKVEGSGPDRVAELRWTAALQTKEDTGMVTDWELKGTSRVAIQPARLVSQRIEGALTVSGRTRKDGIWLRIQGDGYMKDSREVSVDGT